MTIRINNISLDINEDLSLLKNKVAKKLRMSKDEIGDIKIIKESLDARKKNLIKFNYCINIQILIKLIMQNQQQTQMMFLNTLQLTIYQMQK